MHLPSLGAQEGDSNNSRDVSSSTSINLPSTPSSQPSAISNDPREVASSSQSGIATEPKKIRTNPPTPFNVKKHFKLTPSPDGLENQPSTSRRVNRPNSQTEGRPLSNISGKSVSAKDSFPTDTPLVDSPHSEPSATSSRPNSKTQYFQKDSCDRRNSKKSVPAPSDQDFPFTRESKDKRRPDYLPYSPATLSDDRHSLLAKGSVKFAHHETSGQSSRKSRSNKKYEFDSPKYTGTVISKNRRAFEPLTSTILRKQLKKDSKVSQDSSSAPSPVGSKSSGSQDVSPQQIEASTPPIRQLFERPVSHPTSVVCTPTQGASYQRQSSATSTSSSLFDQSVEKTFSSATTCSSDQTQDLSSPSSLSTVSAVTPNRSEIDRDAGDNLSQSSIKSRNKRGATPNISFPASFDPEFASARPTSGHDTAFSNPLPESASPDFYSPTDSLNQSPRTDLPPKDLRQRNFPDESHRKQLEQKNRRLRAAADKEIPRRDSTSHQTHANPKLTFSRDCYDSYSRRASENLQQYRSSSQRQTDTNLQLNPSLLDSTNIGRNVNTASPPLSTLTDRRSSSNSITLPISTSGLAGRSTFCEPLPPKFSLDPLGPSGISLLEVEAAAALDPLSSKDNPSLTNPSDPTQHRTLAPSSSSPVKSLTTSPATQETAPLSFDSHVSQAYQADSQAPQSQPYQSPVQGPYVRPAPPQITTQADSFSPEREGEFYGSQSREIFTLDKPLTPELVQRPRTSHRVPDPGPFPRNFSLETPSPPPVSSILPKQSYSAVPTPRILSPQSSTPASSVGSPPSAAISRFQPKTQSFTSSKLIPQVRHSTPPPFSITSPVDTGGAPPQSQHHHRRSYSISQPVSSLVQEPTSQPLAAQPLLQQPPEESPFHTTLRVDRVFADLDVERSTGGGHKIFKSYSTRETKSARQKREDEQIRLNKSYSTKENKGSSGSPRLLPPVVIKTRTSSVKSTSRSSFIRSRRQSPPSVVDKDYISPFSPTFQRRNSHILQAPTEPIELGSNPNLESAFSPTRSVRSSRSLRAHTVVRREHQSQSPSRSRSASVRFFRKSIKRLTSPWNQQSLISSPSEQGILDQSSADNTTIEVSDHDLIQDTSVSKTQDTKDKASKDGKDEKSTSAASSPSDLQKSSKLRTFQSQDQPESEAQSEESSSHR